MHNSKFIKGLMYLNSKELSAFDKYLNGLYSGQKVALSIFNHIKKFHPNFEDNKLSKAYVQEKVLKLKDSKDKRISNELHKLFQWLEEFLVWYAINNNALLKESILLEVYKEKKNDDSFYRQLDTIKKQLNDQKAGIENFLHLIKVWHQEYYYASTHKVSKNNQTVQKAFVQLHVFYQLLRLKYYCEIKNRQGILQNTLFDYPKSLEPAIDNEKTLSAFDLLSRVYGHLFNLITSSSDIDFNILKEIFCSPEIQNLNHEDQNILLSYLTNHAIKLNKAGKPEGPKHAFDIFDYAIKNEILKPEDSISESRFHNIVNTACAQKEFKWATYFVESFSIGLPREGRESATLISRARISFGRGDFEKTLELLREAKFKDHTYTLQSKILQLRCYYELGISYRKSLKALISSFKIFLKRNRTLSQNTIDSCLNFVRILELLYKNRQSKQEIEATMKTSQWLVCRPWLEQKMESYPSQFE